MENFDPEGEFMISLDTEIYLIIVCFAGVGMGYWFHSKLKGSCSCKRGKTE